MEDIKISLAQKEDRGQLISFFKHYKIKEIIQKRTGCYLDHNFTVVAKDKDKIIGILQWYIKENPRAGVVEFEEMYVSSNYRNKGVGSLLLTYTIQSVKDYFTKIDIKPRKIFLFVAKENKIARTLYERYEFKLVSELGNLFSDTEIELIYCLDL